MLPGRRQPRRTTPPPTATTIPPTRSGSGSAAETVERLDLQPGDAGTRRLLRQRGIGPRRGGGSGRRLGARRRPGRAAARARPCEGRRTGVCHKVEFRLGDMLDLPPAARPLRCRRLRLRHLLRPRHVRCRARALAGDTAGRAARDHDLGPALPGTATTAFWDADPRREARSLQGLQSLGSHLGSSRLCASSCESPASRPPKSSHGPGRTRSPPPTTGGRPFWARAIAGHSSNSTPPRASAYALPTTTPSPDPRSARSRSTSSSPSQRRSDPTDARTTSLRFRARATGRPAAPGSVRCARSRRSGR